MTGQVLSADRCPVCTGTYPHQEGTWPTCPEHHHLLYQLKVDDTGWTYACPASWPRKCKYTHTQPERAVMPAAIEPIAGKQKSDQLVNWLRGQQDELAMAAASHIKPSTIVRIVQGALRKDAKLMNAAIANPLSLLHCCLDAARLGHEPGTDQYYLVPFGTEVTGVEGYKGIIERMFRAGAVSAVVAEVVHDRDVYHRTGATTPPVHEFDEFADPSARGPLRGVYAYAVMLDGRYSKIIAMGRAEIMKHKAVSRGSDRADSPWQKWEESMWKKTVLRGLEPYVPTSSEWLTVRARAAAQAAAPAAAAAGLILPAPARGNGHQLPAAPVVDAEVVDEQPLPHRKQRQDPEMVKAAIVRQFDRLDIDIDTDERDIITCRLVGADTVHQLTPGQFEMVLSVLESCDDRTDLDKILAPDEEPMF